MLDDDFFSTEPRGPDMAKGGYRPNAGAKKRDADGDPVDENGNKLTAYKRKELAQAIKEEHLARQAAVKADLEEGRVVERDAVIAAAAQAFAACSQSLDAIGDSLERDGIAIDVCERVMLLVNAAKEQLALDLEKMHAVNG
jgi:hypothetical protein